MSRLKVSAPAVSANRRPGVVIVWVVCLAILALVLLAVGLWFSDVPSISSSKVNGEGVAPDGAPLAKTPDAADWAIREAVPLSRRKGLASLAAVDDQSGVPVASAYSMVDGERFFANERGTITVHGVVGPVVCSVSSPQYVSTSIGLTIAEDGKGNCVEVRLRRSVSGVVVRWEDGRVESDYELWGWDALATVPSLQRFDAATALPSGSCVYALSGEAISDIGILGVGTTELTLRGGRACSMIVACKGEDAARFDDLQALRIRITGSVPSPWLSLQSLTVPIPFVDLLIETTVSNCRLLDEETKLDCPAWRALGERRGRVSVAGRGREFMIYYAHQDLPMLRVLTVSGDPVIGATVRLLLCPTGTDKWAESQYGGVHVPPKTDEDGMVEWSGGWTLSDIAPYETRIIISKVGYRDEVVESPERRWGSAAGTVWMEIDSRPRSMEVVDSYGAPVSGESIRLRPAEGVERLDLVTGPSGIVDLGNCEWSDCVLECRNAIVPVRLDGLLTRVVIPHLGRICVAKDSRVEESIVLMSERKDVIRRVADSPAWVLFDGLPIDESFGVVPEGAIEQVSLRSVSWSPSLRPSERGDPSVGWDPSWSDVLAVAGSVAVSGFQVEPSRLSVIPWYGGPSDALPPDRIPGVRLPVRADYSVDLAGLHGYPAALIVVLQQEESRGDWVLGMSRGTFHVVCRPSEVTLCASTEWVGGRCHFMSASGLRQGSWCGVGGVALTESSMGLLVPEFVDRVVWRKAGKSPIEWQFVGGGGSWEVSDMRGVNRR